MKIKKITILSLGSFLLASSFAVASTEDEAKKMGFDQTMLPRVETEEGVLGLDMAPTRGDGPQRIFRFSKTEQGDVKIEDKKTQKFLVVDEKKGMIVGNNLYGLKDILRWNITTQQSAQTVEFKFSESLKPEQRDILMKLAGNPSFSADGRTIVYSGSNAIPMMKYIEDDHDLSEKVMVKLKGVNDETLKRFRGGFDKQKIKMDFPFIRYEKGDFIIDIADDGKRAYSNARTGEYLSLDPDKGKVSTNSPVYARNIRMFLEDKELDAVVNWEVNKFEPWMSAYAKTGKYPYYVKENGGFGMVVPVSEAMKLLESRQRMSEEYLPGEVGDGVRPGETAGTRENMTFTFKKIPPDHVDEIGQTLDFGVSGGEEFAIIGPNGTGKSTRFHSIIPGLMA